LTRNDDYWGPKPEIKEVILKGVKEEAARVAGLLAGQADVISNLSIEEIPRVDKNQRTRVEKVPGFRMYFLGMHVTYKPFDNKLVRQAVNHAVDPQVIMKHIFDGNGDVLNGPLNSNMVGYDPNAKRYPYDPKKARELLTQAGYPNGFEVKLHFSPDRHLKGKEAREVIASQLPRRHSEIVGQSTRFIGVKTASTAGSCPSTTPVERRAMATRSDQYFHTGVTRRIGYSNPEFDKPTEEEQKTGDRKSGAFLRGADLWRTLFVPFYTLAKFTVWRETFSGKEPGTRELCGPDTKIKS
jgi:ABC-type oligopeptide transport system substrate-binding subunit